MADESPGIPSQLTPVPNSSSVDWWRAVADLEGGHGGPGPPLSKGEKKIGSVV